MSISKQEEIQAAKEEGYEVVDKSTAELLKEYHKYRKQAEVAEAKMKTIRDLVKDDMSSHGVYFLTDENGLTLVTRYTTTSSRFDKKAATEELGIEIIEKYTTVSVTEGMRFAKS